MQGRLYTRIIVFYIGYGVLFRRCLIPHLGDLAPKQVFQVESWLEGSVLSESKNPDTKEFSQIEPWPKLFEIKSPGGTKDFPGGLCTVCSPDQFML